MNHARAPGPDVGDLVDLQRYPIHEPGRRPYRDLVEACRAEIAARGCVSLPAFLTGAALAALRDENEEVSHRAYVSRCRTNVYFGADDEDLPAHHPKRMFMERTSAFVPADEIAAASVQRRLYDWPLFTVFVADSLSEVVLHKYADPVADTIVNVVGPGEAFPWHFDTNDFSVSILTQPADEGGLFEYAPNIRSPDDENYAGVARVLAGGREGVLSLDLAPGDLQIFKGRNSLHRVTEVAGRRPRFTTIFSYAREPGMIGRVERTRQLYGKVLPVHIEAERAGERSDRLED